MSTTTTVNSVTEVNRGSICFGDLSKMTGFPVDFIKKELLVDDGGSVSIESLREKVLTYLDTTVEAIIN